MATYAMVVVPAAHKAAFEAAAGEVYSDGLGAAWCASATPAGPITHWMMGDAMDEDRLAFYQFPDEHEFVPAGGFPAGGYTEQEIIDARVAARVFTVTAETLSSPDYQQCRDLVTGMMDIVAWEPF